MLNNLSWEIKKHSKRPIASEKVTFAHFQTKTSHLFSIQIMYKIEHLTKVIT